MKNAIWIAGFVVLSAVFVVIGMVRKGGTRASHQIGVILDSDLETDKYLS